MRSAYLLLAALLLLALPAGALRAQDEKDPLEGYSKAAQGLVENLIRSARNLKSYSDQAVMHFETDGPFQQSDQKMTFLYAKPNRFVLDTEGNRLVSDGKELTVHNKQTSRYKTEPLREDFAAQVSAQMGEMSMMVSIADLVLQADPRKKFGQVFKDMDVGEREKVDGERCVTLKGNFGLSFMGPDLKMPATVYLRESDHLVRRVEIDLAEVLKKQTESMPAVNAGTTYKMVFDVKDIKVNESIDPAKFRFEAPAGVKKVEKFYNRWGTGGESADQFTLSGKPAPDFDLETTGGERVHLGALKGKVVVLNFMYGEWGGGQDFSSKALNDIRPDLSGKGVEIICLYPGASADKVIEKHKADSIELPIVLDGQRDAFDEYFDQQFDAGVILVGKDGVVQGRYRGLFSDEQKAALRKDLDKLLAGETLPGGKPMTEDELSEYRDQTSVSSYVQNKAEAVHEELLVEAWSVRARGTPSYSYGTGNLDAGEDIWLRDGKRLRRVGADGQVSGEITLPSKGTDQFVQETVVVGHIGRRLGAVLMATVPGDEQQQGWRPPKGVNLTAVAENGDEIWKMDLEVENNNVPQSLSMADVDGKPGDELVFYRAGAIWIVDERGQVMCRKPIGGWATSIDVKDRDHDRKAELYVRTNEKLARYDYRGRK